MCKCTSTIWTQRPRGSNFMPKVLMGENRSVWKWSVCGNWLGRPTVTSTALQFRPAARRRTTPRASCPDGAAYQSPWRPVPYFGNGNPTNCEQEHPDEESTFHGRVA